MKPLQILLRAYNNLFKTGPVLLIDTTKANEQPATGVPKYASELIRAINKSAKIHIINLTNLPIIDVGFTQIYSRFRPYRKLFFPIAAILTRSKWTLVFSGCHSALATGNRLQVIYDLAFIKHPDFYETEDLKSQNIQFSKALKFTDIFITCSYNTKTILRQYTDKPIYTIYPPLSVQSTIPPPLPENLIPNGFDEGFYLVIGGNHPRKRIMLLVELFQELSEKLIIVGEFKKPKTLPQNIHCTGYIDDDAKTALLSECLTLIMPSVDEGFGIPLIECLSFGKRPICTDLPIFHEVSLNMGIFTDFSLLDLKEKLKADKIIYGESYQIKYNRIRNQQLDALLGIFS